MNTKDATKELEFHHKCINAIYDKGVEQFFENYIEEVIRTGKKKYIYIQLWTPVYSDVSLYIESSDCCLESSDYCLDKDILEYEYETSEQEMFEGIDINSIKEGCPEVNLDKKDMVAAMETLKYLYGTDKQCLIILGGPERIISIIRDYICF